MILSEEQFYRKLNRSNGLTNKTIDLVGNILTIQNLHLKWLAFENCTFNCSQLNFKNINDPDLVLDFINCSFNCDVSFSNCILNSLTFKDTKTLKSLKISKGLSSNDSFELNHFQFSNVSNDEKKELNTDFNISNTKIKNTFSFENINHIEGKFKFLENKLGDQSKNKGQFVFANSCFTNAYFYRNHFNELTTFYNTTFKYNSDYLISSNAGYEYTCFYKNTFEKVDFSNSNFFNKCDFNQCDFLSTTWFENCKNIINSELKFITCKFEKNSLFDNSKFNKIELLHSKFQEKASFENLETNYFKIHQVTFAETAYFDDLNKNNNTIDNWDRKTLRAIKQELQRTENRIDFNRFRSYELAAHYKELNYKDNFKDVAILWATKWSSNYGSWLWALCFTALSGIFWHMILYRMENTGSFNSHYIEGFFVSLLRFFLVTDFYNPFETGRVYLLSIWSWIPFIFGKIFIAFGLYEMIQSFRKFKA